MLKEYDASNTLYNAVDLIVVTCVLFATKSARVWRLNEMLHKCDTVYGFVKIGAVYTVIKCVFLNEIAERSSLLLH